MLIAGRLWKLLGDDEILDRPRDWVLERIDTRRGHTKWELFLTCPWCAGFWLSGVVYGAWCLTLGDLPGGAEDAAVAVGMWLAVSSLVGVYGLVVKALQAASD